MIEIGDWKFPNRVWEPGPLGWYSREATDEDVKRRKALVQELNNAHREGDSTNPGWGSVRPD